jgi:hypothetical protein
MFLCLYTFSYLLILLFHVLAFSLSDTSVYPYFSFIFSFPIIYQVSYINFDLIRFKLELMYYIYLSTYFFYIYIYILYFYFSFFLSLSLSFLLYNIFSSLSLSLSLSPISFRCSFFYSLICYVQRTA